MNQTEIDILNLENRILKDRGDLNNLIYQCRMNETSDALMEIKLREMKRELDSVGEQLAWLKEQAGAKTQEEAIPVVAMKAEPVQNVKIEERLIQERPVQARAMQPDNHIRKAKDMESVIGKSWMGVIASVLIFISIIMFATLLLPVLTDTIKMIVMYGVSIAATAFGLFKLGKDDKKPFYLAVSGCGVGAIYISLILTNFYFKAIGDIVLYLLIAIWAIFVCALSKQRSVLFQVIGQCGILIAVIFGSVLCDATNDGTKFVILVFFYLITSLIFMCTHYQRELSGNLISLLINHVNAWIIMLAGYDFRNEGIIYIVAVVMMLYIVASIGVCFGVEADQRGFGGILTISNLLVFTCFMSMCVEDDVVAGVISLVIAIALIGLTEWKYKEGDVTDKRILQIAMMLMMVFAVAGMDVWAEELLLFIIGAAILVYGYERKDLIYHFGSLTIVMFVILAMDYTALHYSVGILYFVLLLVLALWKKEQYHCGVKLYGYIGFCCLMSHTHEMVSMLSLDDEVGSILTLMIISIVHIVAMKTFGTKKFSAGESERASEIVFGVINAYLMWGSLQFIENTEHAAWHLVSILIAGMLFMANSGNLLKRYQGKKEEMYAGIYVGVKLTVLLWVSLTSFDAANMVVSIACFVLAIIGIMIGFGMQFKSLRIYGLVLSIFSVVKLIMIDMDYDNLLGRAAGFFVCGILCFVISLIYNTIDKNMKKG
ncbi:MAG: hypothetical protein IJ326_00760 [Lachnospiraceae bacterium]|nr:hypothetical protein [Lachnospiraceae bacterium]